MITLFRAVRLNAYIYNRRGRARRCGEWSHLPLYCRTAGKRAENQKERGWGMDGGGSPLQLRVVWLGAIKIALLIEDVQWGQL